MSVVYVDYTMVRGDTKAFAVTALNKATQVPIDLTGAEIKFTCKEHESDADNEAIIQKTSTPPNGIVITAPTEGKFDVTIAPEDTDGVCAEKYQYDIQIKLSTGAVYTPIKGNLDIVEDVTKEV